MADQPPQAAPRRASVSRQTKETTVSADLVVDGTGLATVATGIGMLDHLVDQLARHGLFDITLQASGDLHVDPHHTAEDTAIVLGQAFDRALGDRAGIVRMGHAIVPLDETLALVALDLSGRGFAVVEAVFSAPTIGELPTDLVSHFLETFAREARCTLHVRVLQGASDHHKAEAVFKALARALDAATQVDPRRLGQVPSTKGSL
ncbi:MAG: imidazoleglycerol-phosphate dehydratase HisB [Chloroflexi bacterium]|nr:imidazoleglycerol-phosphate dehydratase HisB [Chloroflexota bacterium]